MKKKYQGIVRICFSAIAVIFFNLICAGVGILVFATYYTPGNPVRSPRTDIDTIGFLSVFIGISQFLYLLPLEIYAARSRNRNLAIGVLIGSIITILLNILFLLELSKQSSF
ncbi:MAG: hypothetical protein AAGA60_21795 [Cyanobacteria bacterium P01_E01_bin.42]